MYHLIRRPLTTFIRSILLPWSRGFMPPKFQQFDTLKLIAPYIFARQNAIE